MAKSANAVLALSRAFYGKRLREQDYDALVNCKTLGEFAGCLKNQTDYAEILSTPGVLMTAEALEELVEKQQFEHFASICRYELAIGNRFYQYFVVKTEIEQILRCTVSLLSGNPEIYLLQMNPFLDKHVRIDLFALGRANTLQEVLQVLKRTPYERIYRSCLAGERVSYLTFELAFQSYFETAVKSLVKSCFSGAERKELHDLICASLDVKLISSTYRALKSYREVLPLSQVPLQAMVTMTRFSQRDVSQFAKFESAEAFLNALEKSGYKDWFSSSSPLSLEQQLSRSLTAHCKKQIRFSVYPGVVMYCYLLLAQSQTENLVRIIEGIKFHVPPQTIRDGLNI